MNLFPSILPASSILAGSAHFGLIQSIQDLHPNVLSSLVKRLSDATRTTVIGENAKRLIISNFQKGSKRAADGK